MKRITLVTLVVLLGLLVPTGVMAKEKLTIWSTLSQPERVQALERIAKSFEAANPGVQVEVTVMPWGGTMDKMVAAIMAGNPPDLATVGQGWPQTLAGTGGLVPLDDVVADLGGERIFLGTSLSVLGRLNGKTYGVPIYVLPNALVYRKSWLAEMGKEPPKTWEELYTVAVSGTDRKAGRFGFAMPFDIHGSKPIWGFLLSNGVTIFDKEVNGKSNIDVNRPEAVYTYNFLADLLRNAAPAGITTYTHGDLHQLMARQVLMCRVDSPETLWTARELSPELIPDFGFAPIPPRQRLGSSQGWVGFSVFDTPRKDVAKRFIKHFFSGSNLIDFCLSFPYINFPPTVAAYSDPRYVNSLPNELKSFVPMVPEILRNAAAICMWYDPNPWAGEIEAKLILPNALSRMLVSGISAEQAVQEIDREIRRIMGEQGR